MSFSTHDSTKLLFKTATVLDAGRYKVLAKNKYGEDSTFVNVTVIGEFYFGIDTVFKRFL